MQDTTFLITVLIKTWYFKKLDLFLINSGIIITDYFLIMHILIIGAGIIGVTTAYELLKDGHKVTVIDRQPEPAKETSYANAGLIAPGHSYAWTTPKLPSNLFKSYFQKNKTFRFKFQWDFAMWSWCIQFLRQCTKKKMKENTTRKHRLSIYSQKCFHKLMKEVNIE